MVTGVNYLLDTGQSKILIDCGLLQGDKELEAKNYEPFAYSAKDVDAVIVSHSHLDHIGRLPQLIDEGFKGKIFATPPAVDFTRLILQDSVKVLAEKARHAGVAPLFSQSEVDEVMRHFVATDYYKQTPAIFWARPLLSWKRTVRLRLMASARQARFVIAPARQVKR